jgi:hypothetical protein
MGTVRATLQTRPQLAPCRGDPKVIYAINYYMKGTYLAGGIQREKPKDSLQGCQLYTGMWWLDVLYSP